VGRLKRHRAKTGEQGYILITAIWLLTLCGAVAAIVMLRGLASAQTAKGNGTLLRQKILLDSAAETVLAERLFDGNHSRWWLVPSSGTLEIDGEQIAVAISSEAGRIDVNEADPRLVDKALHGFGVEASARSSVVGRIQYLRATKSQLHSEAELRALFTGAAASAPCLERHFSLVSGLSEPRVGQMSDELAQALGQPIGFTPAVPEPGTALRIRVTVATGANLIVIARPVATRDQFAAVSRWERNAVCRDDPNSGALP
jgi:hypothetical protein